MILEEKVANWRILGVARRFGRSWREWRGKLRIGGAGDKSCAEQRLSRTPSSGSTLIMLTVETIISYYMMSMNESKHDMTDSMSEEIRFGTLNSIVAENED